MAHQTIERPATPKVKSAMSLHQTLLDLEHLRQKASEEYYREVQALVDKYGLILATGHLSDTWQCRSPRGRLWHSELDTNRKHDAFFCELEALCESVREWGIGPTNMEMFKPSRK